MTVARFDFLVCHGWGLSPANLQPLMGALRTHAPDANFHAVDLGFFGSARTPEWHRLSQPLIAIGHSYGFAYLQRLLAQPNAPAVAGHVSVCGFNRFCFSPSSPQKSGTPLRLLNAMLQRLAADPVATLTDFYERAGLPEVAYPEAAYPDLSALNLDALTTHLTSLRDTNFALPAAPLLALAAADDVIVPPALSEDCFNTLSMTSGTHALPLTHADWCAAQIVNWLGQLNPVSSTHQAVRHAVDSAR
ncbi:hypothetical protein [Parvibium lacunae]|uniref:Alpha/beta hydrolase n=1 Tax=Parvibium lacunae TaxID=1888893 RepID=A0A368L6Q8_9BURK|nr:hypothetical protein [Parvibium lacunae]RCS59307.1 hypothetical protein DU000_00765 [Parvibium lacunae]